VETGRLITHSYQASRDLVNGPMSLPSLSLRPMSRHNCGVDESDCYLICASSGIFPRKRPRDRQHQVLLTRFPPASKPPLRSEVLNIPNMIRSEHSAFNLTQASNIGLSERTTMAHLSPIQLNYRTPLRTAAQKIIACAYWRVTLRRVRGRWA
jgi:hypothetical protein